MFSIPTVYISKEILQRSDHGKFSSEEMEAQLIQALTSPTGKMSSKDRWSPDGRYIEDYLMHKTLKPFRSLDVIGFSVNPEHCRSKCHKYPFLIYHSYLLSFPFHSLRQISKFDQTHQLSHHLHTSFPSDINWHHVIAAVPTLKIIKFIRTNVIKMAISGYRGQQTQAVCGGSNVRDTLHIMDLPKGSTLPIGFHSKKDNCVLPTTVNWTMQEFGKVFHAFSS